MRCPWSELVLGSNVKCLFNYDYTFRDGVNNPLTKDVIHSFVMQRLCRNLDECD
jgi:hypothetical protein